LDKRSAFAMADRLGGLAGRDLALDLPGCECAGAPGSSSLGITADLPLLLRCKGGRWLDQLQGCSDGTPVLSVEQPKRGFTGSFEIVAEKKAQVVGEKGGSFFMVPRENPA
jgi:hypothetical protein